MISLNYWRIIAFMPPKYFSTYLLRTKNILLQNHNILITLRKINAATILLCMILIHTSLLGARMFFIAEVDSRGHVLPAACFS